MANYTEDELRHTLTPGRRYSISLEDCCIEGQLEGVFLGRVIDVEEGMVTDYRFDFGTLGPDWGKWYTEEVADA